MKKIGREVLFLKTGKGNPRNGEGSFIRLKDGRIMYAYTQYYGDDWNDHATARIAAYYSSDEGETWSDGGVLVAKDAEALNIMSVSLVRLNNGDLGVMYLRKYMKGDDLLCMPCLIRSADEGKTFGEPVVCIDEDGYYVVNNDRIVKLSDGRLMFPFAYHGESGLRARPGVLKVSYSDDDGRSWKSSTTTVRSPYDDCIQLQEPGVMERDDGKIWMWCRTAYGHQYQCFSEDRGDTWSNIVPAFRFTSPDSPMQIKTIGKYTLAVFNPIGYNCMKDDKEGWNSPSRTPYVCAVSLDCGRSFFDMKQTFANGGYDDFVRKCFLLEDDMTESYCYPAIIEVDGGFLVGYYHSNGTGICLNSAKITKVMFEEIEK
ncbi:MAG: exo-alpha-sialidase [Ruminococcaceae bacterium]|nr:exo-alpha-sialidase [Oscillospiraceae bacterium]